MKEHKLLLTLAALAFMAWVCSACSDDSESSPTDPDTPFPTEIPAGTDQRPSWDPVNFDLYEHAIYVEVVLQDTLQTYASQSDLLLVTCKDEVRGAVAPKQVDGQWMFPLFIASNESGENMSLLYYNEKLHRIFQKADWLQFDPTIVPIGDDEIHKPIFLN